MDEMEQQIAADLMDVRAKMWQLHEREQQLLAYQATINEIKNRTQKNENITFNDDVSSEPRAYSGD